MSGIETANATVSNLEGLWSTKPARVGSDASEWAEYLLKEIQKMLGSVDVVALGKEGVHVILHYVLDTLIPKFTATAPAYVAVLFTTVVVPLLKKIDEAYFHATT
jgi:hypothetical protein